MSMSKDFPNESSCEPALDKQASQSPRGQGAFDGGGEGVGLSSSPPTFVTRYCEIDGEPFRAKLSDTRKKTCSDRCRTEKSRRKRDPERGSAERRQAQLDGLEMKVSAVMRKAIIRDLSKMELLPPMPRGSGQEDSSNFYDLQHRLYAKRPVTGDPTGDEVYHRLRHQAEQYERTKITTRLRRNRVIDQQLQEQTERLADVMDRLDGTFDLTQRQWLEMKATMTTQARLILERYPDFPQCKEIRSAAERILALDAEEV
jgi:hypothetical protein